MQFLEDNELALERYSLVRERIHELSLGSDLSDSSLNAYVIVNALYLDRVCSFYDNKDYDEKNSAVSAYNHISAGEVYEESYVDPDYASERLSKELGGYLSFLCIQLKDAVLFATTHDLLGLTILLELFMEIYCIIKGAEEENLSKAEMARNIRESLYYFLADYCEFFLERRFRREEDTPQLSVSAQIEADQEPCALRESLLSDPKAVRICYHRDLWKEAYCLLQFLKDAGLKVNFYPADYFVFKPGFLSQADVFEIGDPAFWDHRNDLGYFLDRPLARNFTEALVNLSAYIESELKDHLLMFAKKEGESLRIKESSSYMTRKQKGLYKDILDDFVGQTEIKLPDSPFLKVYEGSDFAVFFNKQNR